MGKRSGLNRKAQTGRNGEKGWNVPTGFLHRILMNDYDDDDDDDIARLMMMMMMMWW